MKSIKVFELNGINENTDFNEDYLYFYVITELLDNKHAIQATSVNVTKLFHKNIEMLHRKNRQNKLLIYEKVLYFKSKINYDLKTINEIIEDQIVSRILEIANKAYIEYLKGFTPTEYDRSFILERSLFYKNYFEELASR